MADGIWGNPDGLHLDTSTWNLEAGDPSGENGDFFVGGVGEKGARWSAYDGGFTGSVNKKGLKSDVLLGGDMSFDLAGDFKKRQLDASLMSGGMPLFDLYGRGNGLDDFTTGLKLPWLGGDASYTKNADGRSLGFGLSQSEGDTSTSRSTSLNLDKDTATNALRLTYPSLSLGFTQTQGPGGETDKLDFNKKVGGDSFSGSLTAGDAITGFTLGAAQSLGGAGSVNEKLGYSSGPGGATTSFGLGADFKPFPGLSLSGGLDASLGDAGNVVSGKLGESYRGKGFAETLSLAGKSDSSTGESFNASGSATAQLLPGLYGSGFGSFGNAPGKDPSYFGGGGLTYMPTDRFGLTAAGGYGSEGWEARVQADFFKGAISGAGDLEAQRKKAAVSAYLGVSGGGGGQMNDVFGAGTFDKSFGGGGGPMFTAGVGIGF